MEPRRAPGLTRSARETQVLPWLSATPWVSPTCVDPANFDAVPYASDDQAPQQSRPAVSASKSGHRTSAQGMLPDRGNGQPASGHAALRTWVIDPSRHAIPCAAVAQAGLHGRRNVRRLDGERGRRRSGIPVAASRLSNPGTASYDPKRSPPHDARLPPPVTEWPRPLVPLSDRPTMPRCALNPSASYPRAGRLCDTLRPPGFHTYDA